MDRKKPTKKTYIPNPLKKDIFYVPNSYGLRILIDFRGENSSRAKVQAVETDDNMPIIVVKRGYLKTIQNMINDAIDIYAINYAQSKLSTYHEGRINVHRADIIHEYLVSVGGMYAFTNAFIEFDNILNGKSNERMKTFGLATINGFGHAAFSADGYLCTYDIKRENAEKYDINQSYIAIDKTMLAILEAISYNVSHLPNGEYKDGITMHQIAAMKYVSFIASHYNKVYIKM